MDDATKRFERYTTEVERGTKSGEAAEKQLRSFSAEFDNLGRRAKAGSDVADTFFTMGARAKQMASDVGRASSQVSDDLSRMSRDASRSVQQMIADQKKLEVALTNSVKASQNARTSTLRSLAQRGVSDAASQLRGGGVTNQEIGSIVDSALGRDSKSRLTEAQRGVHDLAGSLQELDRSAPKQGFLSRIFSGADQATIDRINKSLKDFQSNADQSSFSAVKLAGNLRGTILIGALVFFQQLVGAAISLGGALVAIASAAVQAGAALGGSLVAGVAQALPVVGLLVSAWSRVSAVLNAVKQQQLSQQKASQDATTQANAQASAADALKSAQQGLANAHLQVTVAQEALTKARRDAVRQIQDLVTAEKNAVLQAESSSLALTNAQAAFAQAIRSGDVSSLAGDALQVRSARLQSSTSSRDVTRAGVDARRATRLGVSGQSSVVSAQRSLNSAVQGVGNAQRQIAAAQRSAVTAAADIGSASRTLAQLLAQLSPAELQLYHALSSLYARYKAVFNGKGGVNESIIQAFTYGASRLKALLDDPTLVSTARKLAASISTQLKGVFGFLTGPRQVGFVEQMANEARRNLPILTSIVEKIIKLFENIARAASPALHAFLGFFDDLIGRADKLTGSDSGLAKLQAFFSQGEKYAESFVKLGLAIANLFLAIIGTSAKQGNGAIQSITKSINEAASWIDSHRKQVRDFFTQAIRSAGQILGVLGDVAKLLFQAFNPKQIKEFVDALRNTILPALNKVFTVIGDVAGAVLKITGSNTGKTLIEFGLVFLALSKAIRLVVAPVVALAGGFALLTGSVEALDVLGVSAAAAFGGIGLAIAATAAAVVLLNAKFHFLAPTIALIKTVATDVFSWFKVHWPLVVSIVGGPVGLIIVLVAKFWRQISGAFSAGVNAVVGFFRTMFTRFIDQIAKYGSEILSIVPGPFKKIGRAMANGIVAGFHALVDFFAGIGKWLFDHVIKPIYDFFEISSPSKLFMRIGGQLIGGLIKGLEDAVKGIAGALVGIGEAIVSGIVKGITNAPGALISAITNLLPGPVRGIASKALGLATDIAVPPVGLAHVAGAVIGGLSSLFGGGGSKPAATTAKPAAAPDPTRVIAQALSSVPDDASTQAAFIKQWTTFWLKLIGVATGGKTTIDGLFWDIQWYSTKQITLLYENARNTLIELQTAFEYRSQSIVDIWDSAWQSIQTITFKGLTYVATETNAALKALGSKVINFGVTAPQFDQTNPLVATHAAGGPVVGPGSGTSDSIPARLSNGEHVWTAREVANAGGHGAVYAMRKLFGRGGSGGHGFATGGAVVDDHTGDLTQGQEPQLLTAVRALANYLRTTVEIISAYRTPAHSVAVGGFADDPHTRGQAMDIGVPGGFLYSQNADSVLAKFGLYRPFYPASAKEYDHVQLLAGAAAGIRGSALHGAASAAGAVKPVVDALRKMMAPHVDGSGPMSTIVRGILGRVFGKARGKVSGAQSASGVGGKSAFTGTLSGSVEKQVFDFFKANGFNKIAIAGMIGNALQESGLNWSTPGGGLWQQISNFGSGAPSPLVQMQTMLPQILGLRSAMNAAGSPGAAATIFMNDFEHPNVALENLPRRIAGANAAYAAGYASGGPVTMYDTAGTSGIPGSAQAVAGYLDSFPASWAYMSRAFKKIPRISISATAGNMIRAMIYDKEAAGSVQAHSVGETVRAIVSGLARGAYAGRSDLAAIGAGLKARHFGGRWMRWLADWDGRASLEGYDAHQYDSPSTGSGGQFDRSVVSQEFLSFLTGSGSGTPSTTGTPSTPAPAPTTPAASLLSVLRRIVAPHVGGLRPAAGVAQRLLDSAYGSARSGLKKGLFASGGHVAGPGSGTSDSVWARLSNGEHVWTASEVAKAGGHGVMYAMRRMLGGGGQASGTGYATGGQAGPYTEPLYGVAGVGSLLTQLAAARLTAARFSSSAITSKFTDAFSKTLNAIVGDNGLIDQLTTAVQIFSDKLTANLTRATYRFTKAGLVVQKLTAAQVADATIAELQAVYARMLAEQVTIQAQLGDVAKRLRAGGLSDAAKQQLETAQTGLEKKLAGVRSSIADNVAATYQAEQSAIQALIDDANNRATAASARLSIRQRARALVGGTALTAQGAPSNEDLGKQQAGIDIGQATALQAQVTAAVRSGNKVLASQLRQQIADLYTSAAEAIATGISADVDEINREAGRTIAAIGVKQRIATALGNTDQLAALDTATAAADQTQIVALKAKQVAAIKAGDTALAESIGDQIKDLTASVIEASAKALSDATDQINQVYTRQQSAINIRSRIATALGDVGGIDAALGDQITSVQNQALDLTAKLKEAQAAGDTGLANTIADQIKDLNATVTELTAQRLQAAIDAVNNTAARQAAAVGLTNRLADLQEKAGNTAAAFALRASGLQTTGADLVSQRAGLSGLLATAQQQGNQTDINSLTDSIAELDVQIKENTTAIEANTTTARQAAIDAITNRGSFLGGVYGGIQNIVTTLGALSGTTNTTQLRGLLGQAGGVLKQTGSGLLDQLKSGFGIDLTGQSPSQIAASLSGLNYDKIESGLPVDLRAQFESLINAIIDNTGSQVSNTEQLQQLNAPNTQTWTTTAWQWFRDAIFNGSGGLLPQYQNAALGITTTTPGLSPTPATAAMASASAATSSGGGVFAPQITNIERTVDMDAETLSNRLAFAHRNKPRS